MASTQDNTSQLFWALSANLLTNKLTEEICSKLYAVAISRAFAKKLEGTGVTCNAYNPGGTKIRIFFNRFRHIWDSLPFVLGLIVFIYGKTAEEAAQTPIYLAQADGMEGVTRKFFTEERTFFAPLQMNDIKLCDQLWEESIICTKLT